MSFCCVNSRRWACSLGAQYWISTSRCPEIHGTRAGGSKTGDLPTSHPRLKFGEDASTVALAIWLVSLHKRLALLSVSRARGRFSKFLLSFVNMLIRRMRFTCIYQKRKFDAHSCRQQIMFIFILTMIGSKVNQHNYHKSLMYFVQDI